ncbi:MAG: alpha-glucosidase [Leptospiraceae bacterium]|nr:alpha-glucosidase [Leptospiraceae bacterium]MCP5499314.1 alpha-glucosidase [Leptospiraceae bacterium]
MAWWQYGVIYQIYPRSFKDSKGDGIGDLMGIIEKLDYLNGREDSLGIDAIWLSPVNNSPMVDFGYDVSDYYGIDPVYGDMQTFELLIKEAAKRNIKIIMDLVVNHSSDKHPWFIESRSSKDKPKSDWYIWKDPVNGKEPNGWLSAFGGKAWTFDENRGQYYLHSFAPEQPDLNWRNPELKKAVFDVVRFWLDKGVAGFRLDVVNCFVKDSEFRDNPKRRMKLSLRGMRAYDRQVHVYDRDRPETHEILKELRKILDSYPGERMMVGEVMQEPPGVASLPASYYGNNDELNLSFNFSVFFVKWKLESFRQIIADWEAELGENRWPCNVFSNHDFVRHITRFGSKRNRLPRARLLALLLLSLRGTPFLYYGEELGMLSENVPRKLIHDPPGKKYWPFYKGRDNARLPMCWDDSKYAGFSITEPWLPLNQDFKTVNVYEQQKDPQSLFHTYQKLIRLRKEKEVLRSGKIQILEKNHKSILSFLRYTEKESFLVLINFSKKKQSYPIKKATSAQKAAILFSSHRKEGVVLVGEELELDGYEGGIFALS